MGNVHVPFRGILYVSKLYIRLWLHVRESLFTLIPILQPHRHTHTYIHTKNTLLPVCRVTASNISNKGLSIYLCRPDSHGRGEGRGRITRPRLGALPRPLRVKQRKTISGKRDIVMRCNEYSAQRTTSELFKSREATRFASRV